MQSVTVTFAFVFFVLFSLSSSGLISCSASLEMDWAGDCSCIYCCFQFLSKDWCSLKYILYSFDFTSSESSESFESCWLKGAAFEMCNLIRRRRNFSFFLLFCCFLLLFLPNNFTFDLNAGTNCRLAWKLGVLTIPLGLIVLFISYNLHELAKHSRSKYGIKRHV